MLFAIVIFVVIIILYKRFGKDVEQQGDQSYNDHQFNTFNDHNDLHNNAHSGAVNDAPAAHHYDTHHHDTHHHHHIPDYTPDYTPDHTPDFSSSDSTDVN